MLKLFVFTDPQYSLDTYIVMAEDKDQALAAILAEINAGIGTADTWANETALARYVVESFEAGHVVTVERPDYKD